MRSPSLEGCLQDWMVAWGVGYSRRVRWEDHPFSPDSLWQTHKRALELLPKAEIESHLAPARTTFSQPLQMGWAQAGALSLLWRVRSVAHGELLGLSCP